MSKTELFLELAKPDKNGVSKWVTVDKFVGKYKELQLGNGGSWCRSSSTLAKKYILEFDKSRTSGNSIDAIRTNGFNKVKMFNQTIRADIKNFYKNKNCVMLGINGKSENTRIEIDHKDGRKNNDRVSDISTQKLEDFQPLCKAAKDAKNLLGNPYSYYKGNEDYNEKLGCEGCYQYDPVEYRKKSVEKIATESVQHTVEFVMKKLYGE